MLLFVSVCYLGNAQSSEEPAYKRYPTLPPLELEQLDRDRGVALGIVAAKYGTEAAGPHLVQHLETADGRVWSVEERSVSGQWLVSWTRAASGTSIADLSMRTHALARQLTCRGSV